MDQSAFETKADQTLRAILVRIEDALADHVEADLRGGILTIEFEDGRQYVLNRHGATRQLWLSSPVSGASHYDHDEATGTWRSTRGHGSLTALLAAELAAATGAAIDFD